MQMGVKGVVGVSRSVIYIHGVGQDQEKDGLEVSTGLGSSCISIYLMFYLLMRNFCISFHSTVFVCLYWFSRCGPPCSRG